MAVRAYKVVKSTNVISEYTVSGEEMTADQALQAVLSGTATQTGERVQGASTNTYEVPAQ